jgi:hypothetical protein
MAAQGEKSFCVLEYHMSKSVVTVHSAFRAKCAKDSPTDNTIRAWWVITARVIAAVKNIDEPTLTRVWQELEYRIDVCRVTRGAYIEHL